MAGSHDRYMFNFLRDCQKVVPFYFLIGYVHKFQFLHILAKTWSGQSFSFKSL